MVYRILYNGMDLWTPGKLDLIDPVAEVELNAAGRLRFTMPPNSPRYYAITPLLGTVEVWENADMIWFGRPVSLERNMKNQKECYCEGALAYFNDSAQEPRTGSNTTAAALLPSILAQHNAQVPADRQFTLGTVDMPATEFGFENDYTDSMSAVMAMLRQAGGYLIPRRRNGVNYLDYLYTLPQNRSQSVSFGENLLDFKRQWSFEEKFTAVLPVGGVPEGEEAAVTVESENDGSKIVDGVDVDKYGRIVKVIKYPKITDAAELLDMARAYMESYDFDPVRVDVEAAELSFVSAEYAPFRVGYRYRVVSKPHELDMWLPIVKLSIPLDKGGRRITMGSAQNRGLTELWEESKRQADLVKETIAPDVGGGDWETSGNSISQGGGVGPTPEEGDEDEEFSEDGFRVGNHYFQGTMVKFSVKIAADENNRGIQWYTHSFCTNLANNKFGGPTYGWAHANDDSKEPYTNYGAVVYYQGASPSQHDYAGWYLILAAKSDDDLISGGRGFDAEGENVFSFGMFSRSVTYGNKTAYYVYELEDSGNWGSFPFTKSSVRNTIGGQNDVMGALAWYLLYGEFKG